MGGIRLVQMITATMMQSATRHVSLHAFLNLNILTHIGRSDNMNQSDNAKVYKHTYIHTYIHTYTHTHIHTLIHTCIHTYITYKMHKLIIKHAHKQDGKRVHFSNTPSSVHRYPKGEQEWFTVRCPCQSRNLLAFSGPPHPK
jgi:hypothetical protein